jgi:hypothetical protein
MMPGAQMITVKMPRLFYETMAREKRRILSELLEVKGLVPLLMKPRNGQQWSSLDKRELILGLKSLAQVGAMIALLIFPGGFILVPVVAWWQNRWHVRLTQIKTAAD